MKLVKVSFSQKKQFGYFPREILFEMNHVLDARAHIHWIDEIELEKLNEHFKTNKNIHMYCVECIAE